MNVNYAKFQNKFDSRTISRELTCGEAGNTTVIGIQLYFTSVRQRYKHGGHVERAFKRERKTCFVPFPKSDVSKDETKL